MFVGGEARQVSVEGSLSRVRPIFSFLLFAVQCGCPHFFFLDLTETMTVLKSRFC